MVPAKLKADDPTAPVKFQQDHELFQHLEKLIVVGIQKKKDPHYMPMAKQALNVIYQLGEGPDQLAGSIIKQICLKLQEEGSDSVETFILRRICFLAGQVLQRDC